MSCLVGCIREFNCGVGVRQAPTSHTMSPFVTCRFENNNRFFSVGNESSPAWNNSIAITRFEYGFSDGCVAKFEVVDQEGGAFGEFLDSMAKCTKKSAEEMISAEFSWGWVGVDGFGKSAIFPVNPPQVKLQLMNLEVLYGEGYIKYNITCTDTMNISFGMREDHAFGEDGQKMHLVDAIKKLCQEDPAVDVNFYHRNSSNQEVPGIEWEEGGQRGPEGVWTADSLSRLSVITKWVADFKTKSGNGVVITVDGDNAIALREIPQDQKTCGANSLGTFIVNGGECSNVISFNPTFSWPAAFASLSTGGSSGSGLDGGSVNDDDLKGGKPERNQSPKAGLQQERIPGRAAQDLFGSKRAIKESAEAQDTHIKANKIFEMTSTIEAELRIIGDASSEFVDIGGIIGRYLSIVAINPFHLEPNNYGCGDWLARPGCNPVLSNKGWICKGVNHSITAGDFTTTLKVFLAVPGIDVEAGEPIGGSGSGGYRPRNVC